MLRARAHPRVERLVGRVDRARGRPAVRSEREWLERFVVPGRSFADVGGMWGIHGEIAVSAAELGACPVSLVDFFATEEFERKRADRAPDVRVVFGSADDPRVVEELGPVDNVWCWGVLYHHPAPGAILAALRMVTRERLLLESRTIPEVPGLEHAAVFWPYGSRTAASMWSQQRSGYGNQLGIDAPYDPDLAGANDFWGMTPSAIVALARTCGFECIDVARSPKGPQRHVFDCIPIDVAQIFPFGKPPAADHAQP